MGKPERSERIDDSELLEVGLAYARAIRAEGWIGPFNAQFKRTQEGQFVGFELNGRITGSSAARALSGFDEWEEILRAFSFGVEPRSAQASPVQVVHGVLTHYPVPADGLAILKATGEWRKSS